MKLEQQKSGVLINYMPVKSRYDILISLNFSVNNVLFVFLFSTSNTFNGLQKS